MEKASAEERILLTEDKDFGVFGEMVFREGGRLAGVVLMRLRSRNWAWKWARLLGAIAVHGNKLCRQFTVIDAEGIRPRPLDRG